jgi:hypothetical protein
VIWELAGRTYPAGEHMVSFDAGNLSGGVYLISMKAGEFSATRKLTVPGR